MAAGLGDEAEGSYVSSAHVCWSLWFALAMLCHGHDSESWFDRRGEGGAWRWLLRPGNLECCA